MDLQEIKQTPIWELYEKGRDYHWQTGIYPDTDRNYRMYNGNQWDGAKLGGVEPIQTNFIKPIVDYKVSVVHDNLYAVIFSSQNHESTSFARAAERYCDMLNGYARRIWERDKMDFKGRRITKDSAINSEGIIYVYFDKKKMYPVNEVVKKNDIYYGNENDDDIQSQPYILIRKRMPVSNAIEMALSEGLSENKIDYIIGDNDTFEESGEAAKIELDNMVTVVYKMYKKNGTVHYSASTRWVDIEKDVDLGISLYPVAHLTWEEKEGSARGEGEVKYLIPNQIEVNKIAMRRAVSARSQAFPITVVDKKRIANPDALNTVGGVINTNGQPVDDIHKVVGVIPPSQMSQDVKQLYEDLIHVSRELAGAGDVTTGSVNPEDASGRAILAVQEASRAPLAEKKENYKKFVEDLAQIWLEYLIVHSAGGVNLEEQVTDPYTNQQTVRMVNVSQAVLKKLQASVKIDITPKSAYDRFAQERTLENLLTGGLLASQRLPELKAYAEALPDDSVSPKQKILEIISNIEERQLKIAKLKMEAQMMMQRTRQFLMGDLQNQSEQYAQAEAAVQEAGQISQSGEGSLAM